MRVASVQHPASVRVRPVLDDLAHKLDAEAPATMRIEHVDVGEVHEACRVTVDRTCEADLRAILVEPDDVVARVDQLVLPRARSPLRPLRLAAEVFVHGLAIESSSIVVELVAVAEVALHALSVRRRKPPWYS
jgi:hypothetical protein